MEIKLSTPLTKDIIKKLNAGDKVLLSGIIYTLRDAGHKRLLEQINNKESLPIDINNSIIYYSGPSPARPGEIIGSAGPTTSYRMDDYTPDLLDLGLIATIGKGDRGPKVIDSIKRNSSCYFVAVGGMGALLSNKIKEAKIIAYKDLGTESLMELEVVDFPVIVGIDCLGNNLYQLGKIKYEIKSC